ncbi:MAG TPA: MBL fold metallo-hydrolase [Vicinamibacterales bacterium]|nr:MBL fold metallo-hydrolase [Vicinamibacterales bacterium]
MILESAAVGPFFKNGYVVGCDRTKQAVFIDPGDEVEQLLDVIRNAELQVTHILLTHAHVDHVSGVAEARRVLNAPIYLHKEDLFLYQNAVRTGMMFGLTVEEPPPVDQFYEGEGPIVFGDYEVRVAHTPGHCPGGVCLAIRKAGDPAAPKLFVGDTLFAGSIGRTDLPGGDYETLLRSITGKLFEFPDESIVYSGHGPETTIGHEKSTNPFVLEYLAAKQAARGG